MIGCWWWYGRRWYDAGPVTTEFGGRQRDTKPLLLSLLNPSRFSSSPLESSFSLSLSLSLTISPPTQASMVNHSHAWFSLLDLNVLRSIPFLYLRSRRLDWVFAIWVYLDL